MTAPSPGRPTGRGQLVGALVAALVLAVGMLARTGAPLLVVGTPVAAAAPVAHPAAAAPQPVRALADHPLLTKPASLPDVTCALPEFAPTAAALTAYYRAGIACLDAAWQPVLTAEHLPFSSPVLDASADPGNTPCGATPASDKAVAFYCGRNRTIYMPTGRLLANGGGDRPATHLATLAHEYGHHVQTLAGLLAAADTKITEVGETSPGGLEVSRRIELQANCFGGMFLRAAAGRGSVSDRLARSAEEDFQYAVAEPPERNVHGSPANQGRWADLGYQQNSTAACNTWSATPDEVG